MSDDTTPVRSMFHTRDPNESWGENWGPMTRAIRTGVNRTELEETGEALFLTSGYVYKTAEEAALAFTGERERYMYSRYANPTIAMLEQRLCAIEDAEHCMTFASGMAAMFAALACMLKAGDRVVASNALFMSCAYVLTEQLPRWGIETVMVDGTDRHAWEKALSQPAQAVFLESPSNPGLSIIDIPHVATLAHQAGGLLVVDNAMASPVLQHPLTLGADIVMYSTTKHMDGQGRTLGGALLTNNTAWLRDYLMPFIRHTGPGLSPFNAWVILKGLETMSLRVNQQSDNALQVAKFLYDHPAVKRVCYPALPSHPGHEIAMKQMNGKGGTVLAYEVNGGQEEAFRVIDALSLVDISNNFADTKSLTTHPRTTTHHRLTEENRIALGITPGFIRLSVGLEDAEDVIGDLDNALKHITA